MGTCGAPAERRPWRLEAPLGLALSWSLGPRYPAALRASSSFNPWMGKIPWRRAWQPAPEEPGSLPSMGSRSQTRQSNGACLTFRGKWVTCVNTRPRPMGHMCSPHNAAVSRAVLTGDLWQCGPSGRTVSGGPGVFECPSTPCLLRAPVFALHSHQEMRCLDWGRQRLGTQGRRLAVASFLISVFRCPPGDETHYLLES